jgi:hypothetical protein
MRKVFVLVMLVLLVETSGCVLQQPKAAALSGPELDYQNAAVLARE